MASKEIEFRNKNSLAYHDDICQVFKQIVDQTHHENLQKNKYINCVKYLKLNGFIYYPGAYLIIDLTLKESSSEGLIDTTLNVAGRTDFYLQLNCIISKIKKLNCLKIKPTKTYSYIKYEDLDYKQINYALIRNSDTLLPLRYFHLSFIK
jgi:hypothetical protein